MASSNFSRLLIATEPWKPNKALVYVAGVCILRFLNHKKIHGTQVQVTIPAKLDGRDHDRQKSAVERKTAAMIQDFLSAIIVTNPSVEEMTTDHRGLHHHGITEAETNIALEITISTTVVMSVLDPHMADPVHIVEALVQDLVITTARQTFPFPEGILVMCQTLRSLF